MRDISPVFRKIIVLGAHGQLGKAYLKLLKDLQPNASVIPGNRQNSDLSQPEACLHFLETSQPSLVINAAAYTQVDRAETEIEPSNQINRDTPGRLAKWCADHDVPFVHFSTDYVFSGEGTKPWTETDSVFPLSQYGKSKAEGEQRVSEAGGRFLIFRTSWVYDHQGKNFLNTMLRLGKERETLKIVVDQIGAPTYARDLARGSFQALESALSHPAFPSGIYHLVNSGEVSWHQFALSIFEIAHTKEIALKVTKVEPISHVDYPTPAKRPQNSRLSTDKAFQTFGVRLPHWRDSLKDCMEEWNESHPSRN